MVARMKTPSTDLLVFVVLWTLAIAALSPGIPWLVFLGAAVGSLSPRKQSLRDQIPVALLFLLAALGTFYAVFPDEVWTRELTVWWYQVGLIVLFGFGIVSEYRRWRANVEPQHDA